MGKEPLFKESLGPSQLGPGTGDWRGNWNISMSGTLGGVTCELCGTNHPEQSDVSYAIFYFMGRQGIEQCCGRLLDEAYEVAGEAFSIAYLREFGSSPGDSRFAIFRSCLGDALSQAVSKADEIALGIKAMSVP